MIHIVLVEPEIPHNTGAAGRLAVATNACLHLVEPLGFSIDEKQVRRAGLDYWKDVKLVTWSSWAEFEANAPVPSSQWFLMTTKASDNYWQVDYPEDCCLIFGAETRGLDEAILEKYPHNMIKIPMQENSTRSLNQSTSVGIAIYEVLRQHPDLIK